MDRLKKGNIKKVHIIGSVGSGKTTLAKNLSKQLEVPHYELDNVVWERAKPNDIRRSEEERDEVLQNIIQTDCWIIEGVHHTWVGESFQEADFIFFIDTSYSKRTYRIIIRFIKQKFGLEKANYQPTFEMFRKMFKWNKYFETESKPEILRVLEKYDEKFFIVKDTKKIKELIT